MGDLNLISQAESKLSEKEMKALLGGNGDKTTCKMREKCATGDANNKVNHIMADLRANN